MNSINRICSSGLTAIIALGLSLSSAATAESDLFRQLLDESNLQLVSIEGFEEAELQPNPVQPYEYALRSGTGEVEVRYLIRPLGRITIDYDDPHNAAPEPNHLFPMLFESLALSLSIRGNYLKSDYSVTEARELFGADWAAASVLDVDPAFGGGYAQALVIGIHKDNFADAYTVILFDDYEKSKEVIRSATESLVFGS